MRWILVFVGANAALLAFVFLVLWGSNGFDGMGLSRHGVIALTMGATLTAAVAVGLMALVFYSNRIEHDGGVHQAGVRDREHSPLG
jgi:hypothetical protein